MKTFVLIYKKSELVLKKFDLLISFLNILKLSFFYAYSSQNHDSAPKRQYRTALSGNTVPTSDRTVKNIK